MLNWSEIFDEAFKLAWGDEPRAVPGAKFRQLVARIVQDQGESFPPPNSGKFSKFLAGFPDRLILQSSPGQDILVVPADRPELLSDGKGLNARIRPDLFSALTKIQHGFSFYYLAQTDSVTAVEKNDEIPSGAVKLPSASLANEIALRNRFIHDGAHSDDAKTELSASLQEPRPLTSFTERIKAFGLSRDWHRFRAGAVVNVLKNWSVEHAIPWNPAWLTDGESVSLHSPIPAARLEQDLNSLIQALAGHVSEADLSRISVPLDIVLKLVSQKR